MCFRSFGTVCSKCSKGISASHWVRKARDHVYHLACFRCDACDRQLNTGEEFALHEGRVLCKPHYLDIVDGGTTSSSGTHLFYYHILLLKRKQKKHCSDYFTVLLLFSPPHNSIILYTIILLILWSINIHRDGSNRIRVWYFLNPNRFPCYVELITRILDSLYMYLYMRVCCVCIYIVRFLYIIHN